MDVSTSQTKYFGVKKFYPKIITETHSDEIKKIYMDVVVDALVKNKSFQNEAKKARKKAVKNPNSFPNLSVKYKNFIDE